MTKSQSPTNGLAAGPWLFAHRGTSSLAPENTAEAFDLAMQARADALEIDVRISRDRQIIVTHDADLSRTTNGNGLVADYSLVQLKRLDAGYHHRDINNQTNWRGKSVRLLTLKELFTEYPNVGINIDIKDRSEDAAKLIADELTTLDDGRWINVGSFHDRIIKYFRSYNDRFSTAASRSDVATLYFGRRFPGSGGSRIMNKAGGRVLQIPEAYMGLPLNTEAFIQRVQAADRQVMYWTINDEDRMKTLLARGANGLVSDNIFTAREVIDRFNQGKHSESDSGQP